MRRWIDAALAGLLVVLVAVGSLRWADVTFQPVVALQAGGPFVVLGLALLVLATALRRRWRLTLAAGVALVVALALALPGFFSSAQPRQPAALTVMVANLREGRADAAQVMDAVRARTVDVVVLIEVTPEALESLRERGLDEELPESAGVAVPDSSDGTMVYSRHPMEVVPAGEGSAAALPQPEVTVDVEGTPVALKAVHLPKPNSGAVGTWRDGLRALEEWPAGEGPAVLAGGFSADWGNPGFRALTEDLQDAHRTAGLGWVRTWPIVGHRMPPHVQPDHLLSRGLTVVDAGQVAIHGTDHALVWASYALTTDG